MRHKMLTQHALFALTPIQKRHAELAIRDARRTSSGLARCGEFMPKHVQHVQPIWITICSPLEIQRE